MIGRRPSQHVRARLVHHHQRVAHRHRLVPVHRDVRRAHDVGAALPDPAPVCGGADHLPDPLPAREEDLVDVVHPVRRPQRRHAVRVATVHQRPVRGHRAGDVALVLQRPEPCLERGEPVLAHDRASAPVVRPAIAARASNCSA